MTFVARWTPKNQASIAALWIVVVLSFHAHHCHAALFSDLGVKTISNETTGTNINRSQLRLSDFRRREQVFNEVSGIRSFKSLSCNSAILKAGSTCGSTWSAMFGNADTHTNRIVIPCGVCVSMNHASGTLNLNGGIDIQGKLIVPNGVSINITTPTMIVQGELVMTSTTPVTGIPKIKVTLVGSNELSFTPIDVNANACRGAATCVAGKKSLVVAGGKVTCAYKLK